MRPFRPIAATAVAVLGGLGVLSGTAWAETTFKPEVALGWSYTDNVNYTEEVPTETATSRHIEFVLPVVKTTPDKTFSLSYRPSYHRYEDDFADLDHGEHMVEASLATALDRKNRMKFRADYQDTQSQNYPLAGENGQESLLYYRTERQVFGAFFNLDRDLGRSWIGNGALAWQTIDIDDIEDYMTGIPPEELGERRSFNVSFAAMREFSRGRRLGLEYGYDDFWEENGEDERVHRVRVRTSRVASRVLTYSASAGTAYRVERDDYSFDGSADLVRMFERGQLTFGASHGVANAGVVPGGNTSTGFRVEYTEGGDRHWSWSLSSRYVMRDSDDAGDADIDNLRAGASLRYQGPQLGRFGALGFRIAGYAVDQQSDDDPALDASYTSVSADFVTYLGRHGG
jgi:hypothetical protein